MNSITRVFAALNFGLSEHGVPDRVPILPLPRSTDTRVQDCSVSNDCDLPPGRIADAQIALIEKLEGLPDGIAGSPNVIEDVTGFGVKLHYYYPYNAPGMDGRRLQQFSDIDELTCPEPLDSSQLRKTCEVIRTLRERIGDEKIVVGACIAPFSLPSMLMGQSKWMRLLFTPELRGAYFHKLMDVCTDFVSRWANAQVQAGAHLVVVADVVASATVLPRSTFEQFALPVVDQVIARIKGSVLYDAGGKVEPFLDLLAGAGATALLLGEEDHVGECKEAVAGRTALIGNLNSAKTSGWSASRIELQIQSMLDQGMPGYGFAMATQGPEIPYDAPVQCFTTFAKAVEQHGRYEAPAPAAFGAAVR